MAQTLETYRSAACRRPPPAKPLLLCMCSLPLPSLLFNFLSVPFKNGDVEGEGEGGGGAYNGILRALKEGGARSRFVVETLK